MKTRKTLLIALAVLIALSACSSGQQTQQQTLSEIYSRILGFHDWGTRLVYCAHYGPKLLIGSETYVEASWSETARLWTGDSLPGLQQETWDDFRQANLEPAAFPIDLSLGCSYSLIDSASAGSPAQPQDRWKIYFSQAGFNPDRDQVLVYFLRFAPGSADTPGYGKGTFYLLKRQNRKWTVTGEMDNLYIH